MVLGSCFESARAMLFLFILLNALPVPMLRQVPFSCFFGIVFWFVFGKRLFPVFVEFLSVLGGPGIIIFVPFFDILQFCHEKVEPSFLHTITTFWLDFQAVGLLKIAKKQKKRLSENHWLFGL